MKRKSLLAILLAASMAASMTAATATVAFAETEEAAEARKRCVKEVYKNIESFLNGEVRNSVYDI